MPKPKAVSPRPIGSTPELLVDFAEAFRPPPLSIPDPREQELAALVKARTHLLTQVTPNENLKATVTEPKLRALLTKTATFLQKQADQLQTLMAAKVAAAPPLKAKVSRLTQIQGIGPLTATTLLALMPELDSLLRSPSRRPRRRRPF